MKYDKSASDYDSERFIALFAALIRRMPDLHSQEESALSHLVIPENDLCASDRLVAVLLL